MCGNNHLWWEVRLFAAHLKAIQCYVSCCFSKTGREKSNYNFWSNRRTGGWVSWCPMILNVKNSYKPLLHRLIIYLLQQTIYTLLQVLLTSPCSEMARPQAGSHSLSVSSYQSCHAVSSPVIPDERCREAGITDAWNSLSLLWIPENLLT